MYNKNTMLNSGVGESGPDYIYSLGLPPERPTVHLMRPLGFDWGAYTSASLPVFLVPLCQLRSRRKLVSPGKKREGERGTYQLQSSGYSAEHTQPYQPAVQQPGSSRPSGTW